MYLLLVKISVLVVGLAVWWKYYQASARLPPVVEGFFLPQFRPVAELFRQAVADGTERGASLAVYQGGQALVDLWGGYADPASHRPWREDTVSMTWACTKGPAALAVATLVSRGLLDYKARIQQYWPQFAQNGKDNITVEMLMNHQAGLVTLGGHSISLLDYKRDWPRIQQMMAAAPPDYPPGSQTVYQAVTFGMYVDALVRHADPQHRNLSQYFEQEISQPFGLDYYIGLPLGQFYRGARQHFPPVLERLGALLRPGHLAQLWTALTDPAPLALRAHSVLSLLTSSKEMVNDPRQAEVGHGSLMGFGSAGSLAKMYDLLAHEGSAGSRPLLDQSTVDLITAPLTLGSDHLDSGGQGGLYSLGFQVSTNVLGGAILGHSGAGGQQSWADLNHKLGMAYITNFHWAPSSDPPHHYTQIQKALYDCLQKVNSPHTKGFV